MAATSPEGISNSWLQQKANVARIFSQFQAQDPELSVNWEFLSPAVLCARPVHERFAHFLVHVYVIQAGVKNAGMPFTFQSVLNYLGSHLNRAASRFIATGSAEIKELFFCLESKSGSESAKWLRKLKEKIVKIAFERAVKLGEQLDNSESRPLLVFNRSCARRHSRVRRPICARTCN
uniref:Uncharacterized protein n=1 Tax=Coccolithus braarudii TaxID=221442 RepID=A0A7S0Q1S6_9EUKA|mmetsp:Transcript_27666/g.59563  ORF Transcript_27666/g.59563 Transcript_27666/m.59563 type:complete len:178 (+) Transcript_27666:279-812(+)|eukprot:CAMPEP_0183379522 /NCGR_PEP_ID=MMETSP0164_2-20130417/125465_1 /TAXON_ID=221442 /ORGANISM="Coccolithus pelagicus ssp braarudi, Strain PLY182g" /LENGTH=177 /DNA_ID=CAMNT_0025557105 /DNA_START=268 /DNA_END=801 /DNA_ORIENTATION=-